MQDPSSIESEFLTQITAVVDKNLSNEQFGVSELADAMNMSRSNLLRKVKKLTKLSVSQLISQIRLRRAMEMLRNSSLNVSEVSHQVGFGSTSYFIKCFREYYGYPPGEVGKREAEGLIVAPVHQAGELLPSNIPVPDKSRRNVLVFGGVLIVAAVIGFLGYSYWPSSKSPLERSIAVFPFKNDSNDSTNIYLINGLMESTLNNLQQIKDLKVVSRTSTEKFRNTSKSIPEMAKELNVNYFVEGSGQKIGDRILLNIQLIEASTDKHLWSKQYRREAKDIFELQQEIANNITEEIRAIITPDEKRRIEKKPTTNLEAYDLYLKSRELLNKGGRENLEQAISLLKKGIELDHEFALAYAQIAITYYYLDMFKADKKYGLEVDSYADKALSIDPKLPESLVAKAMFYTQKKEYEKAIPYLEKALEYNPNSMIVIGILSDFYANFTPNTSKYLEYALMGVRLDAGSQDSVTTSYNYLRLANALIQLGFIDESLRYINRSLDYNPNNPFSSYVKPFILYAKDKNYKRTIDLLLVQFNKDTTRFDILQDIAKMSYMSKDYEGAYKYYKRFLRMLEVRKLDVYKHEHLTIAVVYSKLGEKEKAKALAESYRQYIETDKTIYKQLGLAAYYTYMNEIPTAIKHMKLFSEEDNYWFWILLWEDDVLFESVKDLPEVKEVMGKVKTKFWSKHDEVKKSLEEKGLL